MVPVKKAEKPADPWRRRWDIVLDDEDAKAATSEPCPDEHSWIALGDGNRMCGDCGHVELASEDEQKRFWALEGLVTPEPAMVLAREATSVAQVSHGEALTCPVCECRDCVELGNLDCQYASAQEFRRHLKRAHGMVEADLPAARSMAQGYCDEHSRFQDDVCCETCIDCPCFDGRWEDCECHAQNWRTYGWSDARGVLYLADNDCVACLEGQCAGCLRVRGERELWPEFSTADGCGCRAKIADGAEQSGVFCRRCHQGDHGSCKRGGCACACDTAEEFDAARSV